MTVATNVSRADFTITAGTTEYPFTFRIFEDTDLVVILRATDGTVSTLVLNTDYTVDGVGDYNGGKVIVSSQFASDNDGARLVVRRVLDLVQETSIRNQGKFYPETHENVFDRLTMIDQQQQEQINRSLKYPPAGSSGMSTDLPAPDPGKGLKWNATGDGLENTQHDPDSIANIAAQYASQAAQSASDAAESAQDASDTYDDFRGTYYGPLSSDPSTDPLGNPPNQGDMYFNTTTNRLRVYSASGAWIEGAGGSMQTFPLTGDGIETTFPLPATPPNTDYADVYIDGVYQQKDTYSFVGGAIVFNDPPPAPANPGDHNIEVRVIEVLPLGVTDASLVKYTPDDGGPEMTVEDALDVALAKSKVWAEANLSPKAAPDFIRVAGYATAGDGGGALYKKVGTEPSHAGKFSITLSDGVTVVWYEIAEQVLTERMFGAPCDGQFDAATAVGTDATAILQAWADCPVSNVKRFTGVSRVTEGISFPPGTILEGMGHDTGVTGRHIASLSAPALVYVDGSAGLIPLTMGLDGNATKGDTRLLLTSAGELRAGDYLCIYNPTDFSWANFAGRNTYRAGEWTRILSVGVGTVNLMDPLWDNYIAANVDLYVLRSPQVIMRDFRVETPSLEYRAGVKISTVRSPRVDNVRIDGLTTYAAGVMERCVDIWINAQPFQSIDPTPDNEYGWIVSACTGGEIHGEFYAMRHGIAFGNSDFVCCVPNRNITVYANSHNNSGVGSIDFGHGCSENLTLMGGVHSGLSLGGKNHRMIGCKFRKGAAHADGLTGGLLVSGSEFVGGDFVFSDCDFTGFVDPTVATGSPGPINFVLLNGTKDRVRFIFDNCGFEPHAASPFMIRIQNNGSGYRTSLIVSNPRVRGGAGLTQFVRLQHLAGESAYDVIAVTGVKGLGANVPPVVTIGGINASRWSLDPQTGIVTVAGNASAAATNQAVVFPWPYPNGMAPFCQAWMNNASIGGKRCIVIAASVSNTGFTATAMTADASNFANDSTGTVAWRATVG